MTETQRQGLTENIIQVCNCDAKTAEKLLSYCNWDVLTAINLHFSGFDINQIPDSNTAVPAQIVQPINHELYTNFQEKAKALKKWLLVYIKFSKTDNDIFDRFSMYDFINTRFHCLSLEPDDSNLKWFIDFFNITNLPCLAIINPISGELIDKISTDLDPTKITNFLNNFLSEHTDFGRSFDFDLNCTDPILVQENVQKSEISIYPQNNNNNNICTIVLETLNKKRTEILIDNDDNVGNLYQKVSSLLHVPIQSFSLTKYPYEEIRGMSTNIKDLNLDGALVKMSQII